MCYSRLMANIDKEVLSLPRRIKGSGISYFTFYNDRSRLNFSIMKVPKIKLNNGYKIPQIGLGTWKAAPGIVVDVVQTAIDIGYRHIDCALVYTNEKEIGQAIACKLAEKKIGRHELFITSKLWNTHHCPDYVERGIKKTLKDLQLSYLDLYLIHWPMAYRTGDVLIPKDKATGKTAYSKIDYVDTWKAMEKLVAKKLTNSIGLANFNKRQIGCILENSTICPVMNQVECHPYLNQKQLIEYCHSEGIHITCYSPLGSPDRPWAKPNEPVLLEDETVKEIAEKHCKSVAQILLRYQVERGNIVIPKSSSEVRLKENFCIFDFKLDDEDMHSLDCLNNGTRYIELKGDFKHPDHPFANDEY